MDMNIITYLACICFIFVFGRIFLFPLKYIVKLAFNSILGGVVIYIINILGSFYSFHIGLNIFTSVLVGLFRITRSYEFNYNKIISSIIIKINFYYNSEKQNK